MEPSGLADLRLALADVDRAVVAFSGGADSALLARVANDALGSARVRAVTAVSPSLAAEQLADAEELASEMGLRWTTVETAEMESKAYRANDQQRCAHCKDALMDVLQPIAAAEGATVLLGVNADDLHDHRPGQEVAAGRGARFPLAEAGLTKAAVRALSRSLGLRTWDKPAAPCLASRVPYGTAVTVSVLSAVERAESALHSLGLGDLRVRHYGDTARIEVPVEHLTAVVDAREAVVEAVRGAGYSYVTLDLEGLRSGNLNGAVTEA